MRLKIKSSWCIQGQLTEVEISSDVADSKQSIILDQVENGVAIRMAVLYLLAKKIKKWKLKKLN